MERRLGVTEARKEFSQMIDDVKYRGNDYVIFRRGEPAAAIVPFERYLQWKQERDELFDTIRSIRELNASTDPDEVMRDVLEAQQAIRKTADR